MKIILKIIAGILTIFILGFTIYGLKMSIFNDETLVIEYVKSFGLIAPIIFILLQTVQVICPIIPGGASCLAGVIAFGSLLGFIYNYLGLIIGSIISFYLSRKYGLKLVKKVFCDSTINKYLPYIKNNNFEKLLFLIIVIPFFPDDLLCYIAGLSNISFKKFLIIILIGRPISLLGYSLFSFFF